jgi:hypothetical protein
LTGGGGGNFPTYAELMTATDASGKTEAISHRRIRFASVKDLQVRNLIVPVVGDFGGPKAIRAVAAYLKQKEATSVDVSTRSNVEQYLRQDGIFGNFLRKRSDPANRRDERVRSVRKSGVSAGQPAVLGANEELQSGSETVEG